MAGTRCTQLGDLRMLTSRARSCTDHMPNPYLVAVPDSANSETTGQCACIAVCRIGRRNWTRTPLAKPSVACMAASLCVATIGQEGQQANSFILENMPTMGFADLEECHKPVFAFGVRIDRRPATPALKDRAQRKQCERP